MGSGKKWEADDRPTSSWQQRESSMTKQREDPSHPVEEDAVVVSKDESSKKKHSSSSSKKDKKQSSSHHHKSKKHKKHKKEKPGDESSGAEEEEEEVVTRSSRRSSSRKTEDGKEGRSKSRRRSSTGKAGDESSGAEEEEEEVTARSSRRSSKRTEDGKDGKSRRRSSTGRTAAGDESSGGEEEENEEVTRSRKSSSSKKTTDDGGKEASTKSRRRSSTGKTTKFTAIAEKKQSSTSDNKKRSSSQSPKRRRSASGLSPPEKKEKASSTTSTEKKSPSSPKSSSTNKKKKTSSATVAPPSPAREKRKEKKKKVKSTKDLKPLLSYTTRLDDDDSSDEEDPLSPSQMQQQQREGREGYRKMLDQIITDTEQQPDVKEKINTVSSEILRARERVRRFTNSTEKDEPVLNPFMAQLVEAMDEKEDTGLTDCYYDSEDKSQVSNKDLGPSLETDEPGDPVQLELAVTALANNDALADMAGDKEGEEEEDPLESSCSDMTDVHVVEDPEETETGEEEATLMSSPLLVANVASDGDAHETANSGLPDPEEIVSDRSILEYVADESNGGTSDKNITSVLSEPQESTDETHDPPLVEIVADESNGTGDEKNGTENSSLQDSSQLGNEAETSGFGAFAGDVDNVNETGDAALEAQQSNEEKTRAAEDNHKNASIFAVDEDNHKNSATASNACLEMPLKEGEGEEEAIASVAFAANGDSHKNPSKTPLEMPKEESSGFAAFAADEGKDDNADATNTAEEGDEEETADTSLVAVIASDDKTGQSAQASGDSSLAPATGNGEEIDRALVTAPGAGSRSSDEEVFAPRNVVPTVLHDEKVIEPSFTTAEAAAQNPVPADSKDESEQHSEVPDAAAERRESIKATDGVQSFLPFDPALADELPVPSKADPSNASFQTEQESNSELSHASEPRIEEEQSKDGGAVAENTPDTAEYSESSAATPVLYQVDPPEAGKKSPRSPIQAISMSAGCLLKAFTLPRSPVRMIEDDPARQRGAVEARSPSPAERISAVLVSQSPTSGSDNPPNQFRPVQAGSTFGNDTKRSGAAPDENEESHPSPKKTSAGVQSEISEQVFAVDVAAQPAALTEAPIQKPDEDSSEDPIKKRVVEVQNDALPSGSSLELLSEADGDSRLAAESATHAPPPQATAVTSEEAASQGRSSPQDSTAHLVGSSHIVAEVGDTSETTRAQSPIEPRAPEVDVADNKLDEASTGDISDSPTQVATAGPMTTQARATSPVQIASSKSTDSDLEPWDFGSGVEEVLSSSVIAPPATGALVGDDVAHGDHSGNGPQGPADTSALPLPTHSEEGMMTDEDSDDEDYGEMAADDQCRDHYLGGNYDNYEGIVDDARSGSSGESGLAPWFFGSETAPTMASSDSHMQNAHDYQLSQHQQAMLNPIPPPPPPPPPHQQQTGSLGYAASQNHHQQQQLSPAVNLRASVFTDTDVHDKEASNFLYQGVNHNQIVPAEAALHKSEEDDKKKKGRRKSWFAKMSAGRRSRRRIQQDAEPPTI